MMGFLDYRGPRSARKHPDGSLATVSHGSLNAVCYHGTANFVTLRACLVPSGFHTISTRDLSCHKPGSHNLTLHVFLVPGCVAMLALHHDRHKISLPWPQQQTPTASQNSLDYYVARHFRAPSRRMCCFLSPSIPARCSLVFRTLADFLTTVFMLTCCTSESHKTQKSLAVSHVLQTTHKITVSCLVRHTSNCSNGNSPLRAVEGEVSTTNPSYWVEFF